MKKKLISLFLVVAMMVSMLAITATVAGAASTAEAYINPTTKVMKHCACGNKVVVDANGTTVDRMGKCDNNGKTGEDFVGCDGTILEWEAWAADEVELPSATGNYYLTGNIAAEVKAEVAYTETVRIDLNGKTVQAAGGIQILKGKSNSATERAYVAFCDSSVAQTGTMIGSPTVMDATKGGVMELSCFSDIFGGTFKDGKVSGSGDGGIVYVGGGAMNIWDGSAFLNGVAGTSNWGGGNLYLNNATGVVTMYGGLISGGKCVKVVDTQETIGAQGGNVAIVKGTFYMYGGTIEGGTANVGGNLYIGSGTPYGYLYGGTIKEGVAGKRGGAIEVAAGTTVIDLAMNIQGEVDGAQYIKFANGATELTATSKISAAMLRADSEQGPGVYFKTTLSGDAALLKKMGKFGVIVAVDAADPRAGLIEGSYSSFSVKGVGGTVNGTLISGIMDEAADTTANVTAAGLKLKACTYFTIGGATYINGTTTTGTLADYLKAVYGTDNLATLTDGQKAQLAAFEAKFADELAAIMTPAA